MQVNQASQPISWFRNRNAEKVLILKPPYQRKPVWTYKQKAYLIDTILEKYHVPEIYMHRVTDPDGKSIYNIVDGQQRIRTILEFISGKFPLTDEYTPQYADYNFDDLPDNIKQEIWNYTLYVRDITDATESDVRNLFKRMNRNVVALNPQELRHATYSGDFIKLMEELAEDEFWAENKIVTPNEIRRMKDVQFISDLFISMMNGIQDKTKEMDKYYKLYEESFIGKTKQNRLFLSIIDIIEKIFPDLRETRWKNKSDFYTLFMVLREILKNKCYISESDYQNIKTKLMKFSQQLTKATKKEERLKLFPKNITSYANAVTKSTTDKDRRVTRHKIISNLISEYVKQITK